MGAHAVKGIDWAGGRIMCLVVIAAATGLGSAGPAGAATYTQAIDAGNSLNAVSCVPGTSTCIAANSRGNLLYSTNASATSAATWTPWSGWPGASPSQAIACPSITLCVLAAGEVSGGGGNVYRASALGGAFLSSFKPTNGVGAISCPSTSFCVSAHQGNGFIRYSTKPSGILWTAVSIGTGAMTDVSCLSSSFCAVVDDSGNVRVATTEAGIKETGGWTATNVNGSTPLRGIACSSTTSCIAVDGSDEVLELALGSGGGATVSREEIDGMRGLTAVTCMGVTCASVDDRGGIATSTDAGADWAVRYGAGAASSSVSCASASLCAAVTRTGDITVFNPAVAEAPPALGSPAAPGPPDEPSDPVPGQLYAFGWNNLGQLGTDADVEGEAANPTPTSIALPGQSGPVVKAAAGRYHSLALTSAGQLYAFGGNQYGELGYEPGSGSGELAHTTPTLLTLPGEDSPIAQVAGGGWDSFAVTASGELYAFGDNRYGQLGVDTGNDVNPTPTAVTLPGASGPVIQVAAGTYHGLALTSSGELYAFGENHFGQLGVDTGNDVNPTPTPVTLPEESDPVVQVAAGAYHSLALTSSGQLYAFGENRYGQLGTDTGNDVNPTPTPVTLPGASGPVVQIAAGGFHSLALTASGRLYSFGDDESGQLGSKAGGLSNFNPTPQLVTLPAGSDAVVRIAAAGADSLVLTSVGRLYAFGWNRFGQLGKVANAEGDNPNPTPTVITMPGGATIETVALGSQAFHSLAVIANLTISTGSLPAGVAGAPYEAQVQATGGALPYRWSATGLPPGLSIDQATGRISGIPMTAVCVQWPCPQPPASYTATVTATDGGDIQASRPLTLSLAGSGTATDPPPVAVVPVVMNLKASHRVWRVGKGLARISKRRQGNRKRPRVGTTFSFRLNMEAAVTFDFTKRLARRRGGVSRHAGSLSLPGHSGANKVVFRGRISRDDRLTPGRYTLTVTAIGPDDQRSDPASLRFRIVK